MYDDLHGTRPPINTPIPPIDDDIPPVDPDEEVRPVSVEPDFAGLGTLIKKSSGADFRSELAGGTFRAVPSVNYDLVKDVKGKGFTSSSFTASVVAVHSPELIELDSPFTIANQEKFPGKNKLPTTQDLIIGFNKSILYLVLKGEKFINSFSGIVEALNSEPKASIFFVILKLYETWPREKLSLQLLPKL